MAENKINTFILILLVIFSVFTCINTIFIFNLYNKLTEVTTAPGTRMGKGSRMQRQMISRRGKGLSGGPGVAKVQRGKIGGMEGGTARGGMMRTSSSFLSNIPMSLNLHDYVLGLLWMDKNERLVLDNEKKERILNIIRTSSPEIEKHITLSKKAKTILSEEQNRWLNENKMRFSPEYSEKGGEAWKKISDEAVDYLMEKVRAGKAPAREVKGDTSEGPPMSWILVASGIKSMDKDEKLQLSLDQCRELIDIFGQLEAITGKISGWIEEMNGLFSEEEKNIFRNVKKIPMDQLISQFGLEKEEGKPLGFDALIQKLGTP